MKARSYPFSKLEIEITEDAMRVVGHWASLEARDEYCSAGASYEMRTLLLPDDDPLELLRRVFDAYLLPAKGSVE